MNCSEFRQMLDAYIDGELDENQRKAFAAHAEKCDDCREQMRAAEQLRDILSQMDEDIAVPLPAQAAWRSAVRKEAARKRMKRLYSAVGAVAAACVLTLGVTTMLRTQNGDVAVPTPAAEMTRKVAYVQTDGLSEEAVLEATVVPGMARSISLDAPYARRRIYAEDIQAARSYLGDVAEEYDGIIEREADGDEGLEVYLRISGDNVADFINAVDHIGSAEAAAFEYDGSAESLGICVIIAAE